MDLCFHGKLALFFGTDWKRWLLTLIHLFATPWTVAHQTPLSMGFSRQEYWSGLPFPSSGDLPDPGMESTSLMSLALARWVLYHYVTWEALVVTQLYGVFRVSGTYPTRSPTWRPTVLWTNKWIQWPVRVSGHIISCPYLLIWGSAHGRLRALSVFIWVSTFVFMKQ